MHLAVELAGQQGTGLRQPGVARSTDRGNGRALLGVALQLRCTNPSKAPINRELNFRGMSPQKVRA